MVFMYILGVICTYAVVLKGPQYKPYSNSLIELFFDIYLLSILISLLPKKIRLYAKRVLYVVAYLVAIIDLYCFVKLGSTITPTMFLLLQETNAREVTEFFTSYLSYDVIFSRMGWVLLLMIIHIIWAFIWRKKSPSPFSNLPIIVKLIISSLFFILFIISFVICLDNKISFIRLMSYDNIGQVEHELTRKDRTNLYQPIYRLVFSVYANSLTTKQVRKLTKNINKLTIDSCSNKSPNIVLIIGESFNRHHASLYGYPISTTPKQQERYLRGELIPFSDVIAPWNLTSFVFKLMFSTYTVGDKGEWCDYPLFPELFRKASYHVTFLTNQFLPKAKEPVYDFSGGFFLNDPKLSKAMFDDRNKVLHRYDETLLKDLDNLLKKKVQNNLIIFHVIGQHVDYKTRFPKDRDYIKPQEYSREDLSPKEVKVLADYDNAILYNDSIVNAVINRFEDDDAIVIYVPDHGEECFDGGIHFYGRMHTVEITSRLAHQEFDIPFWIWCSHEYMVNHPDIYNDILNAKDKPFMTDRLPHLLLYLAGISTPYYNDEYNILSPNYNEKRPRIIKDKDDYDEIINSDLDENTSQ